MQKVIDVHIGEVKTARQGEMLRALLGSCVGIGMLWKEKKVCGLAHCLLPESPSPTFEIGGRFVDQALRSLMALLRVRPEDIENVEVVIAGGGNMTSPNAPDESVLVGANNFRVALREAEKLGLRVVHADGGGKEGRKIFLNASTFSYQIKKLPRIVKAS